jgi:hypothetical protein
MGTSRNGQLIAAAGGALLIVSLFLDWSSAGGASLDGWEMWTLTDVFLLIVGVMALLPAITGGRIGLFRPDMSINAAADLLGVVSTLLLAYLLLFDWPEATSREFGVYLALIASITIMCGAGDWRPVRGEAPLFPKLD